MTFRIRKRFKEQQRTIEKHVVKHIRLFFILPHNNKKQEEEQEIITSITANCFSQATIRRNKRYILFLGESKSESDEDMSRQKKFHLVSGPIQKSKSFVRSMKKYLCRNCGKHLEHK